jgi:hypothetical protein
MTCDAKTGCPSNTHNLHCGYPHCEKGRADKQKKAGTAPEAFAAVAEILRLLEPLSPEDRCRVLSAARVWVEGEL